MEATYSPPNLSLLSIDLENSLLFIIHYFVHIILLGNPINGAWRDIEDLLGSMENMTVLKGITEYLHGLPISLSSY